jgi:D-sedoheptulose 7-phosphate isomerase
MNSERAARLVDESFKESTDAIRSMDTSKVAEIAQKIVKCYRKDGKVMFCGNGGSASQAQHLAAELVSKFRLKRPALDALALTTDTSILTAQANDIGFETVFERQVEAHGRKGDVLVGLSTSGRSENVVRAFLLARKKGLATVAFVGNDRSSRLACIADDVLFVQSDDTPRIQEAHIVAGHIICDLVETELAGPNLAASGTPS